MVPHGQLLTSKPSRYKVLSFTFRVFFLFVLLLRNVFDKQGLECTSWRFCPDLGGYWDDLSLDLVGEQLIACRWFAFSCNIYQSVFALSWICRLSFDCASRNSNRNENPIIVVFNCDKHQIQINNRDDACVSLDGDAWAQIQGPQQRRVSKSKRSKIRVWTNLSKWIYGIHICKRRRGEEGKVGGNYCQCWKKSQCL